MEFSRKNLLNYLAEEMPQNVDDPANAVDIVALDVSRVADKLITESVSNLKRGSKLKISSSLKEQIRNYYLGYPASDEVTKILSEVDEHKPSFSGGLYDEAYRLLSEGFRRNSEVMLSSFRSRLVRGFLDGSKVSYSKYLKYVANSEGEESQLHIIEVNPHTSFRNLVGLIAESYGELSNYHYTVIIFRDEAGVKVPWLDIARVTLFMEQFGNESGLKLFSGRNKDSRITEVSDFLEDNKHINCGEQLLAKVRQYYEGVSYGYQFEDLFISESGETKVLVMQKVELDESPVRCPSCFEQNVRGNSYPRMLYKSFECQNPECPSRSKIGRGKRYTLYGAKRQMILERNSPNDRIGDNLYKAYRRDIIRKEDVSVRNIISLYSWSGDRVKMFVEGGSFPATFRGRKVRVVSEKFPEVEEDLYDSLRFVKLFRSVAGSIVFGSCDSPRVTEISENYVVRGNSSDLLPSVSSFTGVSGFAGAVSSPPYYNAREYSQWSNLLCYLVDMMVSAVAVRDSLVSGAVYVYNIGDVVGQDNVYVHSNMSRRRLMLGFYSMIIFSLVGFDVVGNIVWDKGEVQSKRNSTANHLAGYVKPVNSYEHCIVFAGGGDRVRNVGTQVRRIDPVKKINSSGVNLLGHSAPYPQEIAELVTEFVDSKRNGKYIVDPFLGSGTTVIALNEEGLKTVGFELDENYYNLALSRITDALNNTSETLF